MFKNISRWFWRSKPRWVYGLLGFVTAFSLWTAAPQPTYGISWLELLLRGAQILQMSNVSPQQEVALGRQINQQVAMQLARKGTPLARNQDINQYLNSIGQRLARTSDRPDIPYTFQVVVDRNINAFATMGGFVYINAGLMETAENEAELASVVAHEIGHIAARHALKQMKQQAITSGLMSVAGLDRNVAVQLGVQLALNLPNSREDELEADQLGLKNLRQAGYGPTAMVSFMEKLQRQGSRAPTFLSSHPATGDRIQLLQRELAANPPTPQETDGLDPVAYKNTLSRWFR